MSYLSNFPHSTVEWAISALFFSFHSGVIYTVKLWKLAAKCAKRCAVSILTSTLHFTNTVQFLNLRKHFKFYHKKADFWGGKKSLSKTCFWITPKCMPLAAQFQKPSVWHYVYYAYIINTENLRINYIQLSRIILYENMLRIWFRFLFLRIRNINCKLKLNTKTHTMLFIFRGITISIGSS